MIWWWCTVKVAPAVELMPKQRHSLPDVLAKAVGGGRSDSSKGAKDLEESHVCSLFICWTGVQTILG